MPTQEYKEKVREEWKNVTKREMSTSDATKVANWWLIKLEEARKEGFLAGQKESADEIKDLRGNLRFIWRWISRMNGDKPHDRPETDWKTYLACLTNYPSAPYQTGDWYEDDETSPTLKSLASLTSKE